MKKSIIISLVGGFILGKAGDTVFGSKSAKKIYTSLATGGVIAKDSIMEYVEKIQAGASDIMADAKVNAEHYYAEKDCGFECGEDAAVCVDETGEEA